MVALSLIFTFNVLSHAHLSNFFNIQAHKPSTKFILMDTHRLNIGWFSFAVCQLSNSVHLSIRACMNCDQEPPNLHTGWVSLFLLPFFLHPDENMLLQILAVQVFTLMRMKPPELRLSEWSDVSETKVLLSHLSSPLFSQIAPRLTRTCVSSMWTRVWSAASPRTTWWWPTRSAAATTAAAGGPSVTPVHPDTQVSPLKTSRLSPRPLPLDLSTLLCSDMFNRLCQMHLETESDGEQDFLAAFANYNPGKATCTFIWAEVQILAWGPSSGYGFSFIDDGCRTLLGVRLHPALGGAVSNSFLRCRGQFRGGFGWMQLCKRPLRSLIFGHHVWM